MARPFDSFVVLAEMRTGSNLLEAILNAFPGVVCHGELFNPYFIGRHNCTEFLGIDLPAREADPLALLTRLRAAPELTGFRFFHDHDPRVLAHLLADRRCAKIVLTRNPIESYVSLQIARATGQWKLTNVTRQKTARPSFDAAGFEAHLQALQGFQIDLMRALQVSGQTAYYIDYEDLQDLEVLNGLARHLGIEAQIDALPRNLKKQNPEPLPDKVDNPEAMAAALARLDRFNLSRTPNFEPRRGPSVPGFRAAARAPLLFQPVPGGPEAVVLDWLAALDGVERGALRADFTRKSLADWQRDHPRHRVFTVLRHPLARAHAVFRDTLLEGRFPRIREALRRSYGLALPGPAGRASYDAAAERSDFIGFLEFVRANLNGQTALRVDAAWASQGAVLRGHAQVRPPDAILREDDMAAGLAALAAQAGLPDAPPVAPPAPDPRLAEICDASMQAAAEAAYGRDYAEFGFGPWQPAG